jgi:hypothetical protein
LFRIEKISDFKKVQILKSWSDLKILDLGKMFKFKKFQILEEVKISNFEKCSDFEVKKVQILSEFVQNIKMFGFKSKN